MTEMQWEQLFGLLNGIINLITLVYLHHVHGDVHHGRKTAV